MNDVAPQTRAAKHLSAIAAMYPDLLAQAAARSTDGQPGSDKILGGDAMVLLAPGANLTAYKFRQMSNLMGRIDAAQEETSGDPDPVIQVLAYWDDELRAERGEPTDLPATVKRCHDYIRHALDWAFSDQAEEFDAQAMLADLCQLRTRMEAVLNQGYRPELGVPCMYDECGGTRLRRDINHHGDRTDWYCPSCDRRWDDDAYQLNVKAAAEATQTEWIDGQLWASVARAATITGISQKRIRKWVERGNVGKACIDRHRPLFVSVAEIRARGDEVA